MAKGEWDIHCAVCGQVVKGPPHGTTCFSCESAGLKYCVGCQQIQPIEAFYRRPDTGSVMTLCKMRYKHRRNKVSAVFRQDTDYAARRNKQSAACKRRRYQTETGHTKEILRCHERRLLLQNAGGATPQDWQDCLAYFNEQCAYCGSTENLTVEHIVPISLFGANKRYSIIPACNHCKASKSDHDILDWYPKQPFYSAERLLKIHSWYKDQQRR